MKALLPKLIFVLVGLVVGIVGIVGVSTFLDLPFLPAKNGGDRAALARGLPTPAKKEDVKGPGDMFQLRDRIVNLADGNGPLRYLKTSIVLELVPDKGRSGGEGSDPKKKQAAMAAAMADETPIIDDQVNGILSGKTSTELMTPEGKQKLKDEIKSKLNRALHEEKIISVYLTDFIIQ